ncbi:YybH family protein [Pontibacter sp. HJ8]
MDITAEIRSMNDKFEAMVQQNDAKGMANLYTEDGMLLPTGSNIIQGREAITDFWQGAMKMGVKQAKLDTLEVEQYDNTAIELGQYTLKAEGDQEIDKGKYIVVWKKKDGQWMLQKDIFNSSITPA